MSDRQRTSCVARFLFCSRTPCRAEDTSGYLQQLDGWLLEVAVLIHPLTLASRLRHESSACRWRYMLQRGYGVIAVILS